MFGKDRPQIWYFIQMNLTRNSIFVTVFIKVMVETNM